jgi:hypothetical protein
MIYLTSIMPPLFTSSMWKNFSQVPANGGWWEMHWINNLLEYQSLKTCHDYLWLLHPPKALVWFWLIDKTLVLTSMLSVWIRWGWYNSSGGAKKMIMVHGDNQEMIKCSTWKRRKKEKIKIESRQRYKQ